jgi:hypothetical protein
MPPAGAALLAALFALLLGFAPHPARAAVVAEGVYTVLAPEKTAVAFRLVLTADGARLAPARGETLAFSYAQKSALVIDRASQSYFLLPLEMVPPLLTEGLGYNPRGLGATASGRTKKLLGFTCSEVLVSGSSPKVAVSSWRVSDPSWSREYALLERSLALPWTAANPPAVFLGIPLAGSIEIQGRNPYKASWVINKLSRDGKATEDFTIPAGYRMDMERLMSVQGGKQR